MAMFDQKEVDMFIDITKSNEAIALKSLQEVGGDINEALYAYFNGRSSTASSNGMSVAVPQDGIFDDSNENPCPRHQILLSPMSSEGDHSPHSVIDLRVDDADEDIFDDFFGPTNQSPSVTKPRDVMDPLDGSFRPDALSFQNLSSDSDDIEDQLIGAAMETSRQEYEGSDIFFGNLEADDDLDLAISLSIKTAEQECAQRLLRDVRSQIMGPPKSCEVEVGKLEASNGRLQAGCSTFQYETEDAEEQPLICRLRPMCSAGVAKNANVKKTSTLSSPGNQDRNNSYPHHSKTCIHEEEKLCGNSAVEFHGTLMKNVTFGGKHDGSSFFLRDVPKQNVVSYLQFTSHPPSPSLKAQRLIGEQQKWISQLAAKEAALPPEPSILDENAVALQVKMPDGSQRGRNFLKSDHLQSLFDFIDIGRAVKPGTYRVVRPYPRHVFSDGEGSLTLNEIGITEKQETLFLELI